MTQLWQKVELNRDEQEIIEALRRHVEHGNGEIIIQVRPGSLRWREGFGHVRELPRKNT